MLTFLKNIEFANPVYLYLLLLLPLLLIYYFTSKKYYPSLLVSSFINFPSFKTIKERLIPIPTILRILSLAFLIIALARPQTSLSWQNITTKGIDIIFAIDLSGSMLAEDFKPNRLQAAKNITSSFIDKRPNDRMGIVIFAGESFTQCPLTIDHAVLKNLLMKINNGLLEDGTAIGMGIATSINRLKESDAISKVIILLTDGVNNAGVIPPLTAAEIAKQLGIRIYTIGVGRRGLAPYPFQTPFGIQYQNVEVKIDEDLLQRISNMTGAKYFRATDNESLKNIYNEIDKLEKSKIQVTEFQEKNEMFWPFALIGMFLIILEFLFDKFYLKRLT